MQRIITAPFLGGLERGTIFSKVGSSAISSAIVFAVAFVGFVPSSGAAGVPTYLFNATGGGVTGCSSSMLGAVAIFMSDGSVFVAAGDPNNNGFIASTGPAGGIMGGLACGGIADAVTSATVHTASCSGGSGTLHVTVSGNVMGLTLTFNAGGACTPLAPGNLNPDLNTYVGGPIQPVTLVHTEVGDQLGCFGMVKVTTTAGPFFPMEGFEAGTGPCDAANPPCDVYLALTGIVASCVAETVLSLGCCTPVFSTDVEPNTGEFLCLRSMTIGIDFESDNEDDIGGIPAATVTNSCS